MKKPANKLALPLAALALSIPVGGAETDSHQKTIVLETPALHLELAPEPAPHLRQLLHKASNRPLVATPAPSSLFTISCRDGSEKSLTIESAAAGKSAIQVETNGSATNAILHYHEFPVSGLFYTYWNEGRDGGKIPSAQDYLSSYVLEEKRGKPKEYVLNESNASGDWKRHSYQFCVAAPETRKFFLDLVDRTHALGVEVLQMDQTTSGAGDACSSTKHGHEPGAGLYQSRSFHDLLDSMRERGKQLSPDFVLFHEEPHEQLIPHLDGFHVREYYEAPSPCGTNRQPERLRAGIRRRGNLPVDRGGSLRTALDGRSLAERFHHRTPASGSCLSRGEAARKVSRLTPPEAKAPGAARRRDRAASAFPGDKPAERASR